MSEEHTHEPEAAQQGVMIDPSLVIDSLSNQIRNLNVELATVRAANTQYQGMVGQLQQRLAALQAEVTRLQKLVPEEPEEQPAPKRRTAAPKKT